MLVEAVIFDKFSLALVCAANKAVLLGVKLVGVGSKLANCVFKSVVKSTFAFEI